MKDEKIKEVSDKRATWSSKHSDILRVGIEDGRTASEIHQLLKENGFTGCYNTVRKYKATMENAGIGGKK